ncbi:MAG: hydrogenase expression/formation protein HypE [Planctomycetota bacterium]
MKAGNGKILLAHGGGGRLMQQLISEHIVSVLNNDILAELNDSAKLNLAFGSVYFTTDSYVVKPLFFNGGDIGKLAVCGTVNDLAVAGAKPIALSLSLIVEAGFELELLDKILDSISRSAKQNNVNIVTGDFKTVEAGAVDKIFINTSGIGIQLPHVDLGLSKIAAGDKIIINGTIGDHGMTVICQRQGVEFETQLSSDCAGLYSLTSELLENTNGVKFMRDPTRGGLAATLNEICKGTGLNIRIRESDIPVNPSTQAAADIFGFDLLTVANEGKFIAVVSAESADTCLNICRNHPLGKEAGIIGEVVEADGVAVVEIETEIGGKRIVQMPSGHQLPRIC